ncbi:free fatty acid receptor 4-like [Liolophura sinensis]|uniref:free fatty acid receptor 4-like n=1 Tax=Liolophura sinensis TaxID=3198878 RepID=UPI003158FAFA
MRKKQELLNSSYFVGEENGHQQRIYFTFFSEFSRTDQVTPAVEATMIGILWLIAFLGNTTIIAKIIRKCRFTRSTNCFILNLALSDNLFVLTAPLIAATRITESWLLGKFLCHIVMYLQCACAVVSIWTMTIISVERYFRIVRHHPRFSGPRAIKIFFVTTWLMSCISFLPLAVYFDTRHFKIRGSDVYICTLVWPLGPVDLPLLFSSVLFAVGFVIPLFLIVVNYLRIFRKFWRSRNVVRSSEILGVSRLTVVTNHNIASMRRRDERDFRVVRMMLLLVGLFLAMWTPVFVCLLGIEHDGTSHTMTMHSQYLFAATCLAYANAGINPLIYGLINRTLVANWCKCCKCLSKRRQNDNNSVFTVQPMEERGNPVQTA